MARESGKVAEQFRLFSLFIMNTFFTIKKNVVLLLSTILLVSCNSFMSFVDGVSSGFAESNNKKALTDYRYKPDNVSSNTTDNSTYSSASVSSQSSSPSSPTVYTKAKIKSTSTERESNGIICKTTLYADGSQLKERTGTCVTCKGTTKCSICGGRGTTLHKCLGCGNSGTCSFCRGTGKFHVEDFTDADGNNTLKDCITGKVNYVLADSKGSTGGVNYSSPSSNMSSSSSSSSSNSGKANCKYCRGSGNCSKCKGKGWHDNTLSANPVQCPSCNGNGRCFMCHGRGYYYY